MEGNVTFIIATNLGFIYVIPYKNYNLKRCIQKGKKPITRKIREVKEKENL